MTYAEKIIEIRENLKFTRNEFSTITGVQAGLIGKWENGRVKPNKESLRKLISALEIPQDTFVGCHFEKIESPKRGPQNNDEDKVRHVILHHTPKKTVKVDSGESIKHLTRLRGIMQTELQDCLMSINTIKGQVEVYEKIISELSHSIIKIESKENPQP